MQQGGIFFVAGIPDAQLRQVLAIGLEEEHHGLARGRHQDGIGVQVGEAQALGPLDQAHQRRLLERGVRFVQLYHRGWDHHGGLPGSIRQLVKAADQPCAALIKDLKQRGMLDETLIVWGGEFGRTVYSQGTLTKENYGRDHHPRNFTMWLAGGGIKPGIVHGETDDFSYNITEKPVHVHDLNATILHLLGIDHEKLTYRMQGRDFRLTDIHGKIVTDILA